MESVTHPLVRHARQLAREVSAQAVVVYADAVRDDEELALLIQEVDFPAILVTRARGPALPLGLASQTRVTVPDVPMSRAGQAKAALLVCLARGVLRRGDRVICLAGDGGSGALDTLLVLDLGGEVGLFSLLESGPFGGDLDPAVFERALTLAAEVAAEGREGRPVGALLVLGDSEEVLARTRSLVLNPFRGHPEADRNLLDPALEETVKEFSTLDGAFVVRGDGVVVAAGVQLVPTAPHAVLGGGLGTRHAAAAGITASTEAVAVCVSQSTGTVSVYRSGRLVADIPRASGGGRFPL